MKIMPLERYKAAGVINAIGLVLAYLCSSACPLYNQSVKVSWPLLYIQLLFFLPLTAIYLLPRKGQKIDRGATIIIIVILFASLLLTVITLIIESSSKSRMIC